MVIYKAKDWDKEQQMLIKEPCFICGTKKKLTEHHLKSGKKIPLCRPCHDEVEEAKVYINSMKSRKAAFKRGVESERERLKIKYGKKANLFLGRIIFIILFLIGVGIGWWLL